MSFLLLTRRIRLRGFLAGNFLSLAGRHLLVNVNVSCTGYQANSYNHSHKEYFIRFHLGVRISLKTLFNHFY